MISRSSRHLLIVMAAAALVAIAAPVRAGSAGERLQLAQGQGLRFPAFRVEAVQESAEPAVADLYSQGFAGPGRLGAADADVRGNVRYSLDERWTSRFATEHPAPDAIHERRTVHGLLERNLPGGWGVGFGLRRSDFLDASSNVLSLSAGGQWGDLSGAYTLFSGLPDGRSTESRRLQLSYRYAERGSVGFAVHSGRDMDYLGPLRGLSATEINNWSLGGQHRLASSWALTYDMVRGSQGSFVPRQGQGLKLGLRHDF